MRRRRNSSPATATLRDKTGQAAYVEELKARFGRKRNFMKLLG